MSVLPSLPLYTLTKKIYQGKKSLIYQGYRNADRLPIVIKTLKDESPSPKDLEQLRHEYAIYQKLNASGLSSILQVYGLLPFHNSLFLVLEDFGGRSLYQLFDKKGMSLKTFLTIGIKIAEELDGLHSQHLIHKDINPSNILFNSTTEQIKIIDFGISTFLSREKESISSLQLLEGTAAYLSPEQTGRINRAIDYRTDIYSLGATLYELLTQKLPFEAQELIDIIHLHIAKLPSPPHEVYEGIPEAVSTIIMKCLAKEAEERYQSAYGLKNDLEECLNQLTAKGTIELFALAQKDLFGHFQIPQKLYGREKEIDTLFSLFERISQGETALLLIFGYSGIGKSSIVQEMRRPIEQKRGHFIAGKFEQFQQNTPYSALIQAFRKLVQLLLAEKDLDLWKERFLKALGFDAQIMIDVIPELKLIIGEQSPVVPLNVRQAELRFHRTFASFIQVFLKKEHPLVLFVDDLQWADAASLKLLEFFLIENQPSYLLIIGAYRDNEVGPLHPLMGFFEKLKQIGHSFETLEIAPLSLKAVQNLVSDTLHNTQIAPLAQLIYQKTQGNPFFVIQFLKTIYQAGLLSFEKQSWVADLAQIEQLKISDNVAELMSRKIQELPLATQELLKAASAIGHAFDLSILADVCSLDLAQVSSHLWEALQEEFISIEESKAARYVFEHDRIQQAAYQLIPQQERSKLHYAIGRVLLNTTSDVMSIVNQLNYGRNLIEDQEERMDLARLNLQAGQKAKDAVAYPSALEYFKIGKDLLTQESWDQHYELAFFLYQNLAICHYLTSQYQQAEEIFDLLLKQAKSKLEQAQIYHLKNSIYTQIGEIEKALVASQKGLKLLGVDINLHPHSFTLLYEIFKAKITFIFIWCKVYR